MRLPSTFAAALVAITLLTSCGSAGGQAATDVPASSTPSSTPSPSSNDPTDGGSSVPEGTTLQTAKQSGAWDLVLREVRVAEHPTFDRIVLEFAGTGTPGWAVEYVDEAVLDGSGRVVKLDGDAIVHVGVEGTIWPASGDRPDPAPQPARGGDVVDMYVGGSFEGYSQVFAGIEGDREPFRVFALTDPSRLVVDLVQDGAG